MVFPHIFTATPRRLPKAASLEGRVVVLDIAFSATISKKVSFEKITKRFIDDLGPRLALWVDHHDHEAHENYRNNERFLLCKKSEHGACPEMINKELVRLAGPVDTIVCHLDFDGLYSAAKWILGGIEPYDGADKDAWAVDTRLGVLSKVGRTVDHALRAYPKDDGLRMAVIRWLVERDKNTDIWNDIESRSLEFQPLLKGAQILSKRYKQKGVINWIDVSHDPLAFDKTELLLLGQKDGNVSAVIENGSVTVAAAFNSQWNFVELLDLEGGMPTRVSVSASKWEDVCKNINDST